MIKTFLRKLRQQKKQITERVCRKTETRLVAPHSLALNAGYFSLDSGTDWSEPNWESSAQVR